MFGTHAPVTQTHVCHAWVLGSMCTISERAVLIGPVRGLQWSKMRHRALTRYLLPLSAIHKSGLPLSTAGDGDVVVRGEPSAHEGHVASAPRDAALARARMSIACPRGRAPRRWERHRQPGSREAWGSSCGRHPGCRLRSTCWPSRTCATRPRSTGWRSPRAVAGRASWAPPPCAANT